MTTTTCSYSNPLWILKSGEVRTLEPLGNASTNANFQFGNSICYSDIEIELNVASGSLPAIDNGFTHGEVVLSVFVFLIFVIILWRGIVGFSIYNREIR